MNVRPAIDISKLPVEEFGSKDTLWWGTMALILAEGTSFALLIVSYFYYRMRYTQWPPADAGVPWLNFSVPNLILMLVICYPMWRISREAPERDPKWLAGMLAFSGVLMLASVVLRYFEFQTLQTDWNEHSYGSITWALLFFHWIELMFACGETAMLAIYCATQDVDRKHRADLQTNTMFWYFLVITWIIIFNVIYVAGRVL